MKGSVIILCFLLVWSVQAAAAASKAAPTLKGRKQQSEEKKGKKVTKKGKTWIAFCGADNRLTTTMYSYAGMSKKASYFNRIASFQVCSLLHPTCNTSETTAAELVSPSGDGKTLVYSDSPRRTVGFIDIEIPNQPIGLGVVPLSGEPTSVTTCKDYAFVVVNESPDFVNVTGSWHVINITSQEVLRTGPLPGQPDSAAWSANCQTVVVAIENERNEDILNGTIPQLPAGSIVFVDTSSADVQMWSVSEVNITGLPGVLASEDPEPEFVSINADGIAVVTLQENNAMVLIDTKTGAILNSFSAGSVSLQAIDVAEEGVINQTASLESVPREPDGVAWLNTKYFATADEGDFLGGSRGFTIFDTVGNVVYTSGSTMDHMAARVGHYPEGRSGNKGNEPENIAFGIYGDDHLMFVNSERSSLVFVYDVANPASPVLLQVLPAGTGPEGGYAMPKRDLFLVASEVDDRGDKIRAVVNIYARGKHTVYTRHVSPAKPTFCYNRRRRTRLPHLIVRQPA